MRSFRDAKAMASTLRLLLGQRQIELQHSECLELIAKLFGLNDWNTLSARINAKPKENLFLPYGWVRSGSRPEDYDMGTDTVLSDKSQAMIRCKFVVDDPDYPAAERGFGTLMQSVVADEFRGKTLQLAADLRVEDVSGAGTIWMRIERAPGQILRFDNMEDRPKGGVLRGTSDWTRRDIVLDVPEDAASIHYGFYLRGTGTVYARGLTVAEAGRDDRVSVKTQRHHDRPTNLAFARSAASNDGDRPLRSSSM